MPIQTVEKPITIAINNEMKYCFLYLLTAQLSTSCKKKKSICEQEQIKKEAVAGLKKNKYIP
jgi:hypothetical protein